MFKMSKNPQILELTNTFRGRYYRLLDLKRNISRTCIWCLSGLKGNRQKWCSSECALSVLAWARPQKEHGLYNLLVRQDWKCNHCFYDYAPALKKVGESNLKKRSRSYKKDKYFWLMKNLRHFCDVGRSPEVDHVTAIVFGGQSLGLENVQALCESCHKEKTKKDNKERWERFGHPLKGAKFSKDHCEALSKVRKGVSTPARRAASQKSKLLISVPVVAINILTKEEFSFDSIADAARSLNLQHSNISRVLNAKQGRKKHKGWIFNFKVDNSTPVGDTEEDSNLTQGRSYDQESATKLHDDSGDNDSNESEPGKPMGPIHD